MLRIIFTIYVDEPILYNTTQWTMHIFVINWLYSDVLSWMESARVLKPCDLPTVLLRSTGRSRSTYWAPLVYIHLWFTHSFSFISLCEFRSRSWHN